MTDEEYRLIVAAKTGIEAYEEAFNRAEAALTELLEAIKKAEQALGDYV